MPTDEYSTSGATLGALAGFGVPEPSSNAKKKHLAWCSEDRRTCGSPEMHLEENDATGQPGMVQTNDGRARASGEGQENQPARKIAGDSQRQHPTDSSQVSSVPCGDDSGIRPTPEEEMAQGERVTMTKRKRGQRGPDKQPRKRRT